MNNKSPSSITYIKTADIVPPPVPVRERAEDEDLPALAESIKSIGLLNPLIVREKNSKFQIVCGHRRYLAAKMAGLEKVPCIVTHDSEDADIEKMLAENIARKDMSPLEEAHFFNEAIEKLDHTPHSLACHIGRTKEYVKRRLAILKYPTDLQRALHKREISLAVAEQLARINDEEVRSLYLADAIQRQTSAQTVQSWVDMWEANKQFKEEGYTDPRQTPTAKRIAEVRLKCELCRQYKNMRVLRSMILCEDCQNLIRDFYTEYMRQENGEFHNQRATGAADHDEHLARAQSS